MRRFSDFSRVVTLVSLVIASVLLYRKRFLYYDLQEDDFTFAYAARTWQTTWESVTVPFLVHFCPLFRLLTGLLVSLASRPAELRVVFVPPMVAVLCLLLISVYAFLERETGRPLAGMLGVILFGLSSNLADTFAWYGSSGAQWSVLFLILTLLSASLYQTSGSGWALLSTYVLSFLAPCWWTIGILAGPSAAIYLLLRGGPSTRSLRAAVIPILGSLSYFVPVVVLGYWTGASGRFQWLPTIGNTFRGVSEVLVLRNCGLAVDPWSMGKCLVYLLGTLVVATWWFIRGSQRSLMLLGISLCLMSYIIVYGYAQAYNVDRSGRYQLVAQFGLALFIAGGLRKGDMAERGMSVRDTLIVVLCATLFWCTHRYSVALTLEPQRFPMQAMQLGQLELILAEARRQGIGMDLLREAIGPFRIEGSLVNFDGLSLLEASLPATTPAGEQMSSSALRARINQLLE